MLLPPNTRLCKEGLTKTFGSQRQSLLPAHNKNCCTDSAQRPTWGDINNRRHNKTRLAGRETPQTKKCVPAIKNTTATSERQGLCRVHPRLHTPGSRWKHNWEKSKQIWRDNFSPCGRPRQKWYEVSVLAWSSPNCVNIPLFRRWWRRIHSKRQLGWLEYRIPGTQYMITDSCNRCPSPSLNTSTPGDRCRWRRRCWRWRNTPRSTSTCRTISAQSSTH